MMILKANELKNFISKAKAFCDLIEDKENVKSIKFLNNVYRSLLDLYLAYQDLPDKMPESDIEINEELKEKDLLKIRALISKKIGEKYATYWQAFDPIYPNGKELNMGFLSDDLADIYQDLKRGLSINDQADNDETIKAATLELEISFLHWGHHSIDAIRALHFLVHDHMGKDIN